MQAVAVQTKLKKMNSTSEEDKKLISFIELHGKVSFRDVSRAIWMPKLLEKMELLRKRGLLKAKMQNNMRVWSLVQPKTVNPAIFATPKPIVVIKKVREAGMKPIEKRIANPVKPPKKHQSEESIQKPAPKADEAVVRGINRMNTVYKPSFNNQSNARRDAGDFALIPSRRSGERFAFTPGYIYM